MRLLLGADHAADRGRSVAQRRRSADDLDLVGRQRIDRHEMILAEIGGSVAADPVLDDADAVDVQSADDRPAGSAGRKARSGDAGFAEQEIAERGAAVAADFLVRHHRDGRELVGDDRQHALLGRGSCRCGSGRRRRSAGAAGGCLRDARGHAGWRWLSFHDRAWRRHRDVRQCGGCILGQRASAHRAQRQPARAADVKRVVSFGFSLSQFLMPPD